MKFGQLILRKIIKIVAKMYQNRFQTPLGELNYSAPQTPSWNEGYLLLREGEGRKKGKGGEEGIDCSEREGIKRKRGGEEEGKGSGGDHCVYL